MPSILLASGVTMVSKPNPDFISCNIQTSGGGSHFSNEFTNESIIAGWCRFSKNESTISDSIIFSAVHILRQESTHFLEKFLLKWSDSFLTSLLLDASLWPLPLRTGAAFSSLC